VGGAFQPREPQRNGNSGLENPPTDRLLKEKIGLNWRPLQINPWLMFNEREPIKKLVFQANKSILNAILTQSP
jgi:hypothetical protein